MPIKIAPIAAPQSILPILSVNFVGTLGFSIVLPFMVFLVTKWGGNAIIYGVLASTYAAFQLIGAPLLGRWSDRYGRRKVLLASQLGTMVSWLIFLAAFVLPEASLIEVDSPLLGQFTLTLPLVVLFVARAADGLTGGNVSVANAYLADITDEAHRAENFGRMAVSTNVGFVAGPALAGLLGATFYGEVLPVAAALLISIIASVMIASGLTDYKPAPLAAVPDAGNACKVFGQESKQCYTLERRGAAAGASIWRLPHIPVLMAINFLVMLGFSFFYIAFPTHAATGLDWSVTETGVFFAVLSLAMVIVQGPLMSALSGRVPEITLVVGGALLLAAGFAALIGGTTIAIYGGALLIAAGNGVMWPTFMATLSARAGAAHQGAVQGAASSLGAAASIVGLLGGGLFYIWFGPVTFGLSAAIILAVAVLAAVGGAIPRTESAPAD